MLLAKASKEREHHQVPIIKRNKDEGVSSSGTGHVVFSSSRPVFKRLSETEPDKLLEPFFFEVLVVLQWFYIADSSSRLLEKKSIVGNTWLALALIIPSSGDCSRLCTFFYCISRWDLYFQQQNRKWSLPLSRCFDEYYFYGGFLRRNNTWWRHLKLGKRFSTGRVVEFWTESRLLRPGRLRGRMKGENILCAVSNYNVIREWAWRVSN